mgnify:CR=1 FL=1
MKSGEQLFDHAAFADASETEVEAGILVGEAFVVEAEQVQQCGVQVVDVDFVLDGSEAKLIRGTVGVAASQ